MNPDVPQTGNNPVSQPAQPSPTDVDVPAAPSPAPSPVPTSANYGTSEDAKISNPKYWLTVYGVFAVYVVLEVAKAHLRILSLVIFLAWLVVLIICYQNISKLKVKNQDVLSKDEKYKMVFYMAVDPVFAQAFYYYRLKKSLPQ